ncbi:hypothetical protein [uncultured Methylobacterium sp.]|uniref:hypothetical protein n=1 Tax=uncultured Methylobacterium sp. TaxID=157278 RepID=UPI002614B4B3|nr:hypothetical protein [uncultured Methylobacterium sp.]
MRAVAVAVAVLLAGLAAPGLHAQEAAPKPGAAAPATPVAIDLLFDAKQLRNAAPGSTLSYRYTLSSGIEGSPFGPPVEDRVQASVEPGKDPDTRTLTVQTFTGARRLPTAHFEDMSGNPVIGTFLEHHVLDLAKVLKGNPRYLKNAIRKALRDGATVTPTEVTVNGVASPGWRVEIKPLAGDPIRDRLRGFDALTYTFVVSPAVPGEVVSIAASALDPQGGKLLEETLTYEPSLG